MRAAAPALYCCPAALPAASAVSATATSFPIVVVYNDTDTGCAAVVTESAAVAAVSTVACMSFATVAESATDAVLLLLYLLLP